MKGFNSSITDTNNTKGNMKFPVQAARRNKSSFPEDIRILNYKPLDFETTDLHT